MHATIRRAASATALALGVSVALAVAATPAHAGYPSEPGTNTHYVMWQYSGTCPNRYQLTPSGWKRVCI